MAAPTWQNASGVITQPSALTFLSSATVSNTSTASVTFQSTDSVDVNNWGFYQHLVMFAQFNAIGATQASNWTFVLNDDDASSNDWQTAENCRYSWEWTGSGGGSSYAGGDWSNGAAKGTMGEHYTCPYSTDTDSFQRVTFYDINTTSMKSCHTIGGVFNAGVGHGGMCWGTKNLTTHNATNQDGIWGSFGSPPITKITMTIVEDTSGTARNFSQYSRFDLYGMFWNMEAE